VPDHVNHYKDFEFIVLLFDDGSFGVVVVVFVVEAHSSESAAVCLTSDGVAHIISIPQLKLRHLTSIMDSGELDRL